MLIAVQHFHEFLSHNLFLQHNFGIFYLADATGNAFQNFYNNVKGIQNSFGNFWQVVVRRYKSFPNVLGYEILNEPVRDIPFFEIFL